VRLATIAFLVLGLAPLGARAQELLALPDASIESGLMLLDPSLDGADPDPGWDPVAIRAGLEEKLFALLPGGILEDVARTFVDRTVQLDVRPDRAFLRLRLNL
jgi:hypothetical protein